MRRNKVWCLSPSPFLRFSSHSLNNYGRLLGHLFLRELRFELVLFLNLVRYGPICRSMMHPDTFVFWYSYLQFYSTIFLGYLLTQNHLIFQYGSSFSVFSFTSLDSNLFGESFALFLSEYILILSWRRPLYRNQSVDFQSKLMNWFLYDNSLRHESVNFLGSIGITLFIRCVFSSVGFSVDVVLASHRFFLFLSLVWSINLCMLFFDSNSELV